jgi:hypothetical protein
MLFKTTIIENCFNLKNSLLNSVQAAGNGSRNAFAEYIMTSIQKK